MPNQHTVKAKRAALRQIEVSRWERERQQRVEAICAAITAQRQALSKVGNAHLRRDRPGGAVSELMGSALAELHTVLAAAVNETNPFTSNDDPAERLAAMIAEARDDVRKDTEHWEELACGQDTEEAEESGRMIGYAEGLEAALKLLKGQDS